jgi:chromosome segregation ATPase
MRNPALATLSVLLGLSLAAGAWLLRSRLQVRAEFASQLEKAQAEAQKERERAAALLLENEELRRQLAEKGITPKLPPAIERGAEEARRLAAVRELAAAQTRLAEAQAALLDMKNRVAELEASLERASAENRRLAAAEAALNEDLENTRRIVQAMEAEIRAKNDRLAQLETTLRRTREELASLSQRSAASSQVLAELAEINRRRENTVTSLQRRYRDITDQLRALAVRLDTQRDNPAAAAGDLSRIQTAVLAAEEDLKQLNVLNSQSQQLMLKLSGR